jgi:NAD(P)-dependent dehydrogenase (short-subunit alcohol dehydrogenase family)
MTARRPAAFVTGASQGIGAAVARALAGAGYDLAVSGVRTETLAGTVAAIEAAGARAVPIALDLRSQSAIERAMAHAVDALGGLDLLVNNAGITLRKSALEVTREEWDALLDTNLTGTFFMSREMGRHLVATKRPGCIVSLASTHGLVAYPQRSTYGITKAGIVHMTRMLAVEWAPHGIRVNAVAPGTVKTPSRAEFFRNDPAAHEALIARVPLKSLATPEDVGAAVCYLASPQAAYITGQTLVLDGGLTAY